MAASVRLQERVGGVGPSGRADVQILRLRSPEAAKNRVDLVGICSVLARRLAVSAGVHSLAGPGRFGATGSAAAAIGLILVGTPLLEPFSDVLFLRPRRPGAASRSATSFKTRFFPLSLVMPWL